MDSQSAYEGHRAEEKPAGRIACFDPESGALRVDLTGGGSLVGVVTTHTWVEGGDEGHRAQRQLRKWYRLNDIRHEDDLQSWHRGPSGSPADLRAGAVVEDAVVVLRDGRAYFAKIELTG